MMSYGHFYLSLGLVISVWMYFENKWHQKENDEALKKILRSKFFQERRIHEVVMSEVIAPLLFFAVGSFVWPGLLYLKFKEHGGIFRRAKTGWPDEPVFELKRENLLEKLNVQEIEEREIVRDPLGAVPVLPFGHLNHAWKKFLDSSQADCELWSFSVEWSPWGGPELRKGYVQVCSKGIDAYFLTVCRDIEKKAIPKKLKKKWWGKFAD
jgi:hypothetical protein